MIVRPTDPNPLFAFAERETVVKGLSPLQAQRAKDGTQLTSGPTSCLAPPDKKLSLNSLKKSATLSPQKKQLDADAVVKAFLAGQ